MTLQERFAPEQLIAAHQLLLRHARPDDDATVLVLR